MGHIGGFCHLYIGQEAVVRCLMTIDKNDSVVTHIEIMAICKRD